MANRNIAINPIIIISITTHPRDHVFNGVSIYYMTDFGDTKMVNL